LGERVVDSAVVSSPGGPEADHARGCEMLDQKGARSKAMAQSDASPAGSPTLSRDRGGHLVSIFTTRAPGFFDITDAVGAAVHEVGAADGIILVYSCHTTAAIKINENEPLLLADMESFLARLAPADAVYQHNNFEVRTTNMTTDEEPNGHAHCRHLLLPTSETIPLVEGRLVLGRWQRIFLVELDHPRQREVFVKVIQS
jgi:secondary thiamine-phosphate synthase enzyme